MGVAAVKGYRSNGSREGSGHAQAEAPPIKRRRGRRKLSETEAELNRPIEMVFVSPEGDLHHAWCHQPLEYQGRRGALEVDFYCVRCIEHVSLPEFVLPRIPVRALLRAD
jgi:hypothetical protein